MKQVSNVKRVSQYKTIYIPDSILEDMGMAVDSHCIWVETDSGYALRKVNVEVEE
jgi:hypothetical protein